MNHSVQQVLKLQCPVCAGPVQAVDTLLQCGNCGQRWPFRAGVMRFGESADFGQHLDEARLTELLSIADRLGWQIALHDHLRQIEPHLYRAAVDEYQVQWRCLIPSHATAQVLDFRSGWGRIALGLAEDFAGVVAADVRYELARLTALRAAAAGAGNVQPMCLDPAQRLPFSSGSFDVVILHEAVEWSPAELLREVARVLAPGGWLFMLATNRFSPGRLLKALQVPRVSREPLSKHGTPLGDKGKSDGTASVRFPQYRSLLGYQQALTAVGLQNRAAYALLPSATEPFYIVPLGGHGALRYLLDTIFNSGEVMQAVRERHLELSYRAARVVWELARRIPVEWPLHHFLPSYGLLATKGD
jgi:SAM-dependent methyltransferase